MNDSEDLTTTAPEGTPEEQVEAPVSKGKISKDGSGGTILMFFIFGFVVSLIVGWVIFPELLYSRKPQPINFNHALHNELVEEGCESCHYFREDGSFSGVPKLSECVECHEEVNGTDPEEEKFVTQYVATGTEVPWLIYSKQPQCVFFSHAAHVKASKMDCVECHGHHGESSETRDYERNRLTGYSRDIWGRNIAGIKKNSWDRMKMNDCADCHALRATFGTETETKGAIYQQFKEAAGIVFSSARVVNKGSSVQTEKDACFVCHK